MVDVHSSDGSSLAIVCVYRTTEECLKQAQVLAPLAMADASMVKVFAGRWSIILRKLELLPAQLVNLADSAGLGNSVLCKELLHGVVSSLIETKDLASKCMEDAFGGKLQMQSNLDALAMKLGLHLRDLELLMKSGVLRDTTAPKGGGSGASRETVKWNVRDLLARLQIGNAESKQKAMESLVELMQEDDKNVLVVAGQDRGIPTVVHLLDAGVISVREKAAAAVCRLSQIDSCEHLLVNEGALAPLVRLLESGTPVAKEKAAAALKCLTFTPENARSVAAHGGVPALIEICQSGTPGAQAAAAGALRNLASISEVRQTMAEEDAIPVLIGLITSGTPSAQEYACDALQNLSSSDEHLRQAIVREGAIHTLLMYFDTSSSSKAKEVAMAALSNLAASAATSEELLAVGFLPRLVVALKSGLSTVQQAAASAVCHLARSMELRRTLGEAGCVPPLVRMLEGKTSATQELAAQAIFNLILVDSNRRTFCKEERSISRLVQLLDPTNQSVAKKSPISALLCLSGSKKCRKQMIAAGARISLGKLAEMEVIGARKLLDRLEGGSLWSLFRV